MALERLQKILAHAGVASRRVSEEIIAEGRVTIDGQLVTELGTKADPARQDVRLDGRRIHVERPEYWLLNKPKGVVCTNLDPSGRSRPIALLASYTRARLFPVGRLDADSKGLLLMTNDGEFANLLAHPRYEVPKTYLATVAGTVTNEDIRRLADGIHLSEGLTKPAYVDLLKRGHTRSLVEITIREGRNRQIRRMLARLRHPVRELVRVRIGRLTLRGIGPGRARPLTADEVEYLKRLATQPRPAPQPPAARATEQGDRPPRREDRFEGCESGRPPRRDERPQGRFDKPPRREGRGSGKPPWREDRPSNRPERFSRREEGQGRSGRPPRREDRFEGRDSGRPPRREDGQGRFNKAPRREDGRGRFGRPPRREDSQGRSDRPPRREDRFEGRDSGRPPRRDERPQGRFDKPPRREGRGSGKPPWREDRPSGRPERVSRREEGQGRSDRPPRREDRFEGRDSGRPPRREDGRGRFDRSAQREDRRGRFDGPPRREDGPHGRRDRPFRREEESRGASPPYARGRRGADGPAGPGKTFKGKGPGGQGGPGGHDRRGGGRRDRDGRAAPAYGKDANRRHQKGSRRHP